MTDTKSVDLLDVLDKWEKFANGLWQEHPNNAELKKDLLEARAAKRAAVDLLASQSKSREVLRAIVRDRKGGNHRSAAIAACHEANAALAAVGVQHG